jgi:hypothetical protein
VAKELEGIKTMKKNLNVMALVALVITTLFAGNSSFADPGDIEWTDNVTDNPVIVSPGFGDNRAYYGHVLFDPHANIWRAWYDASSGYDLSYAESTDAEGLNWTNYTPCVGFTSSQQSKGFVVQLGPNEFRMWYMAEPRGGGYIISSCVSSDGINWENDDWITGIAEPDMNLYGPVERIAVQRLDDGSFVAYTRCEEIDYNDVGSKRLYRYTSDDGIEWTWTNDTLVSDIEDMSSIEFSSVVKHPDKPEVWYAWGNNANSEGPFQSFVSVDDGLTFTLDENPVAGIGEVGTQTFNQDRNYHGSATYLGDGNWIMFRTVAEPKATAIATGKEEIETSLPTKFWELH